MKKFTLILICISLAVLASARPQTAEDLTPVDHDVEFCGCIFSWEQVCGTDNVVYGNKCMLECEAKKDPGNYISNTIMLTK